METAKLKKFAQLARRNLLEQVSAKLTFVLAENSAARRERPMAVNMLEGAIKRLGTKQIVDRVAYIWFNRFCALRFMDVNRYNRIGVVSPAEGQLQPEILAEAKMGHIDEEMVDQNVRQQVFAFLNGKAPSRDPQGEAYRLLVVAACNYWSTAMPFLFQRIDDYTELLMPDDLLSCGSILSNTREAMTPEACKDVEVIGWLYQYYISEKKDEVFVGLKKNIKVTPENIPAATQLFTPHWIVRYLVENSLGRLWLLNRPGSKLAEKMDYYINPEQAEPDFLRIAKAEEIKICDPACGSGHMLTYAFDLLYAIYEEEGYEPAEIPEKILTHNLYGIEIDERAGELAAFALTMKALQYDKRFFRRSAARGELVEPNICVLQNIALSEDVIGNFRNEFGEEIFSDDVIATLKQFEEVDNFGSLIVPKSQHLGEKIAALDELRSRCSAKIGSIERLPKTQEVLLLTPNFEKIRTALRQAEYLSQKYHVVVANPPYMDGKGMNGRLGAWLKDNYPDSKSNLFSVFMDRNLDLVHQHGAVAMITMESWMFLSSFEAFRARVLGQNTLLSMAHLGTRAFDSINGEKVSTTAFILQNGVGFDQKGAFLRLINGKSESEKNDAIIEAIKNPNCGWFFRASAEDFKKIPGAPVAYWVSDRMRQIFNEGTPLGKIAEPRKGNTTTDNARFLRFWPEISQNKCAVSEISSERFAAREVKWCPYNKGGGFRKWFGFNEYLVNWEGEGEEIKAIPHSVIANEQFFFKPGWTWSTISSGRFSIRQFSEGYIFDNGGCCVFGDKDTLNALGPFMNSAVFVALFSEINPTLNFQSGEVAKVPIIPAVLKASVANGRELSKADWDFYETSWDFTSLPLLSAVYRQPTIKATYQTLRAHWREMTLEMQRLEEENNRIFIDAYGLQDELTPEVPLNEITLTCNPHYRYNHTKPEAELEALLLADTMRELVSYSVGCMFGRYSLDKPGLILANQGETLSDYLKQIPAPSFSPDHDNVIPMLDGDWFPDDIVERFRKFLRVAFGEEHYEENLKFIEQALNIKDKSNYTIRDYFLGEFYTDHLKRYKKRPIYWLFSSPKGSFNALIYMHRYRPDTVSVVLNDYLREFRTKLTSRKSHLEAVSISANASSAEKTKALKDIDKNARIIAELEQYEREVMYPLATRRVEIDLDDGVKVNYPKFGRALRNIPGLDASEED